MSDSRIYILSKTLFNKNMIKIGDVYVSITVYLLQIIYICLGSGNRQHQMLANPEYNNISVDNYYQDILQIFLKNFLNMSPLHILVIYNIQC